MTLRERLADWLTGGALTRARDGFWEQKRLVIQYRAESEFYRRMHDRAAMASNKAGVPLMAAKDTLRRIAACETPGANATVRRMAKMAREAVE